MKNSLKALLTGSLCLLGASLMAQLKPFSLKGEIEGKTDGFVYLSYQEGLPGKKIMDSALVEKGKFLFKGQIDGPQQATILAEKNPQTLNGFLSLLLSPGELKLSLISNNFSQGILKGTDIQEDMNRLNQSKAALHKEYSILRQAYDKANMEYILATKEKKDSTAIQGLKDVASKAKAALGPIAVQIGQKDKEFMEQSPASFVTASLLLGSVRSRPVLESIEMYNKLSPEVINSNLGKAVNSAIEKLKTGSVGATAIDFSTLDVNGEQLNLSDYKGKYVLLDFWASWCVPCRKGNPHLLSLYTKYKPKGFEIIGVSDDDSNPEIWKKAIEKDRIGVWKHILRGLKKSEGGDYDRSKSISDKYTINSLPTKILIDPKGVIIGRYGEGGNDEELDKKLAEIFGS